MIPPGAFDLRIRQLPTTPIEFTNDFYNSQGDIIVQRTNININCVKWKDLEESPTHLLARP